jgi:hypothetical protein
MGIVRDLNSSLQNSLDKQLKTHHYHAFFSLNFYIQELMFCNFVNQDQGKRNEINIIL